jgi:two-component system phosphate regulon sensor histidine kinase PhoR
LSIEIFPPIGYSASVQVNRISLQRRLTHLWLLTWRTRAFWLRAFICWLIGAAFLMSDQNPRDDLRFQIRGPQKGGKEIVLVDIPETEWTEVQDVSRNVLRPLKEISNFSDSFFWNTHLWQQLLGQLLADDPAAIGVSFFFGDNIHLPGLADSQLAIFHDPKIIWGADFDNSGRLNTPAFALSYDSNVGIKTLPADEDGIVRRFSSTVLQVPHFAQRLAQVAHLPGTNSGNGLTATTPYLINYMGGHESYPTVTFLDVVKKRLPPGYFKNKIIIIGSSSGPIEQLQTPLGKMSRAEVLANITDNVVGDKWIGRFPKSIYLVLLLLVMFASLAIVSNYPQSAALVFFVCLVTLLAAISAWIFDAHYFWLPVLAPTLQVGFTYMAFLSYQLALNEQKAWRLQEEQRYLSEIEQLKSNFVSMMSHDLKTPIAKIQAIIDRLLTQTPEHENASDLKTLRRTSDDLHKYIQSILRVTKVEARDFKLNMEVSDINDEIDRVVQLLTPLAQEKGIELVTKLEPMFSIEVDRVLIQEVILNLVENALKYTPNGGRITLSSQEKDDNVQVVIEDTGTGIAPADQAEIWGKFTRGKNQGMDVKGTGLGLYLVKYFIELHGGSVFLESVLGKGTRVGFSIPLESSATSSAAKTV